MHWTTLPCKNKGSNYYYYSGFWPWYRIEEECKRETAIITYLFQFTFGNTTDAVSTKVSVSRLNATKAAQVLVALLLPFGNQIGICNPFLQAIVVQFCK